MNYSKAQICHQFGISRQAFYKQQKVMMAHFLEEQLIIAAVRNIRKRQPRVGGRKLHKMVTQQGIEVGRDKLFVLLRKYKLLVKPVRKYNKTTNSYHRFRKYPNIIKELEVTAPNQVFVVDITYLDTLEGYCYLVLVTDLYSRKIVGWDLSRSLAIEGAQRALKMALRGVPRLDNLIHHSDRGIQFCSNGYVKILTSHDIQISMTEENHVYENAVAERVNGTLKTEFLLGAKLPSFKIAKELTAQSIKIYNHERLHLSLNYQTPAYRYAA